MHQGLRSGLALHCSGPVNMGPEAGCTRRHLVHLSHPPGACFRYDGSMRKERKPSPTESPLLFEIDPEPIPETLTALGGIPLVVQAFRSLGLPSASRQPE